MDLSYGSQYEAFRQETRRFIEANAHLAPRVWSPTSRSVARGKNC